MTLLTTCQDAAILLTGERPASIFSGGDTFATELGALANEAAADIASANDWTALTAEATLIGDGSTKTFALPSDYSRRTLDGEMLSLSQTALFREIDDPNQWVLKSLAHGNGAVNDFTVRGNNVIFAAPLAVGESAILPYQKNTFISGTKSRFDSDGDTFALSERLLKLALIMRWRQLKRLEYDQDEVNFRKALAQEISFDGGRDIRVMKPTNRWPNAEISCPPIIA